MKLATLANGRPDGHLVVVSRDLSRCVSAGRIAPTLRDALDEWDGCATRLADLANELETGGIVGQVFNPAACMAPLPRAHQWIGGSGYLAQYERSHTDAAGGATSALTRPLLYQSGSGNFTGPYAALPVPSGSTLPDMGVGLAVICGAVPIGAPPEIARASIRLMMLCNDVTLRRTASEELESGLGLYHAKPLLSFAPVAVTPDLSDGKEVSLTINLAIAGRPFGRLESGRDVAFGFDAIIAEAARTRPIGVGTVIGGGVISHRHDEVPPLKADGLGFGSIADARAAEKRKLGRARTPYLASGDTIRIEAMDETDISVFGAIEQRVEGPGD